MKVRTVITTIVTVAAVTISTAAFACGESLYRVGKGVSYRAYSAPLPANLLVYARTNQQKEIAAQLAKAGHGVRLVESPDQLTTELNKGGYDVVIAPFSARGNIDTTNATYLPIVAGTSEQNEAKGLYQRSVTSDGDVKDYLKAIHRALKKASKA